MTDIQYDFSLIGYAMLLKRLQSFGYIFKTFFELESQNRHIILRHDIDFSLEYAIYIGEQDALVNAKSTFFILLATEFYNIFTRDGRSSLRQLLSQGHEIGLHFDRSVYDGDEKEMEKAAAQECSILEDLIGQPVRITAFHRPAQTPEVLGRPGLFAGRPHAYAPEYFHDIAYVSDGAGYWSHGHPLDHPAITKGTAMQLLTHPYLWMGDQERSALESIECFRRERERFLESELRRNLRYYPR